MHYPHFGRWRALLSGPALALALSCTGSVTDVPSDGSGFGGASGQPPGNGGSSATGAGTATSTGVATGTSTSNGTGLGTGNGTGVGTGNGTGVSTGTGGSGSGSGTGGSAGSSGAGASGGTGPSGIALKGTPTFFRVVRLTHEQWEASVRDLLKLSALPGLSSGFATDPPNGMFSNNERALFVSSTLWSDYQRAAETLSTKIAGDAQAISRVTGGTTDSAAFIRAFGRRMFRRPLTSAEEASYKTLFGSGPTLVGSGNAFNDGVRLVIESMLQSPNFLYRTELGTDGAALSGYEMASKLSFLLRNTTPDDALLDAAAAGGLDTQTEVVTKATAMLEEAAAKGTLGRYHAELFGLARYANIDKNRSKFPAYTDTLNSELEQADRLFFDKVFTAGQGLRGILTSATAFVSSATAGIYGVTASGQGLVETQLGPERPGFLTRLGFLAYNANLSDPDPIHRGVDVINRLLCLDLMPPANVEIPPLPAIMPGQTNRERVTAHTGDGTCGAGCHSTLINPVGFAFENFDAIGQLRTTDNGKAVDTSGRFSVNGELKDFGNVQQFVTLLAGASNAHGCYVKHLAEFALTRDIAERDRALVDGIEGQSMNNNASVKAIVLAIVGHPSFLTRTGGVQ